MRVRDRHLAARLGPRPWTIVVALLVGALGVGAWPRAATAQTADRPTIELKVSPTSATVDDQIVVVVEAHIPGVSGAERYIPPEWPEFDVVDTRRQTMTQMSSDFSGHQSITTVEVRSALLKPRRAGKLRIGEARIRVNGVEYQTRPVIVQIAPSGQAPVPDPVPPSGASPGVGQSGLPLPDASLAASPIFIYAHVDRERVKVGEQVTVTWYLWTRSEVVNFAPSPPRFDAFSGETLFETQNRFRYVQELLGGQQYSVAVIIKKALFAAQPGKFTIAPYTASVATLRTMGSRQLRSNPLEITVDPLPPGAPADFDAAMVGRFEAKASVDRTSIPAGEPIELTLTVRGEGPIRSARIPTIDLPGFTVYPPRTYKETLDLSGDKVAGTRSYAYLLTPKQGGDLTIDAISVPFYNPATGAYEAARTEPITITVVGVSGSDKGSPRDNVIARDIRPPLELAAATPPAFHPRGEVFWLALHALWVPPALFACVLVVGGIRSRLSRETTRTRRRRAKVQTRARSRAASAALAAGKIGDFYKALADLLRERLEACLGGPIGALTRAELRARLGARGVSPAGVDLVIRELDVCDAGRYAPGASEPARMQATLDDALAAAAVLDEAEAAVEAGAAVGAEERAS